MQAAWTVPPRCDHQGDTSAAAALPATLRANPIFSSDNVTDAFVVDMPAMPPRPPHLEAARPPVADWQRAKFARVRKLAFMLPLLPFPM